MSRRMFLLLAAVLASFLGAGGIVTFDVLSRLPPQAIVAKKAKKQPAPDEAGLCARPVREVYPSPWKSNC
jgi:hypothetical protein